MRGRSQVVCISSSQHNLCPAPNGSGRCLHLLETSEPRLRPPRRHSLAHEVHTGSYVTRVNLWACLFRGLPCQQPDPGPRLLRKIRNTILQGSRVPSLQTTTAVSLRDIDEFLRGDEESSCRRFLLTIRVERTWIPPHPAEIAAVDSGEIGFPTCSEHGNGRMEVVFDSSRGRCRGHPPLCLRRNRFFEHDIWKYLQTPSTQLRSGSGTLPSSHTRHQCAIRATIG